MGKKRSRSKYTSAGLYRNVSKNTLKLCKQDEFTKEYKKVLLWKAGKNPWITIPNPVKQETKKRFIRVRANDTYGDPKGRRKDNENRDNESINLYQR